VLAVPDMKFLRILILHPAGEVFYASAEMGSGLVDYYRSEAKRENRRSAFLPNPLTGESEFIASSTSEYSGLSVILVLNRRVLLSPLRFVRAIGFGIGLLIILFSVLYTWVSSRQLTKPLKLMQSRMDGTELSDLPLGTPLDHPNDEIAALDRTFRNLTARLDESIRHELDSRTLWMQARLDSLQAQVNPHFINNILTVIANRGLESGDLRIGDICQGVASMLRYSTSTAERSATLELELEHVRTYLFLMKERLEGRLLYNVEAEASVLASRVPKIILQQIVENSINHGYRKSRKPIAISISARAVEDRWLVEMKDDGEGFDPVTLADLDARIRSVGLNLGSGTDARKLGIGGSGLINTYSRLFLYFRGDITWTMGNEESGGARVVIGAPLDFAGEESGKEVGDAADSDRRG
jgi:two-component system sensor histidine kinase YesM